MIDDEADVDMKDKLARQELEELDLKYLIGDNDDEDALFRGFSKPTQNKQKQQENLAPMVSPYIPRSG